MSVPSMGCCERSAAERDRGDAEIERNGRTCSTLRNGEELDRMNATFRMCALGPPIQARASLQLMLKCHVR